LNEVHEMVDWLVDQHARFVFSTVITKSHLGTGTTSEGERKVCHGFHKFTVVITTTRLITLSFKETFLQ
jgi:hypothetical protein